MSNPVTDKDELHQICRDIWALVERVRQLGYDAGYEDASSLVALSSSSATEQFSQQHAV